MLARAKPSEDPHYLGPYPSPQTTARPKAWREENQLLVFFLHYHRAPILGWSVIWELFIMEIAKQSLINLRFTKQIACFILHFHKANKVSNLSLPKKKKKKYPIFQCLPITWPFCHEFENSIKTPLLNGW